MSAVVGMFTSVGPAASSAASTGTSLGAAGAVGMVLLAPTAIVTGALAARETAEKNASYAAKEEFNETLADLRKRIDEIASGLDESTRAMLDELITNCSRSFYAEHEENTMSLGRDTRVRMEKALAHLLSTLHVLFPQMTFDAHLKQRMEMSKSQIDAALTVEKLRAEGLARAIDFDVTPDNPIDLKRALLQITAAAESSSGVETFEGAAQSFDAWSEVAISLMQDEALDMALRNRISAKFESIRAAYDALDSDSTVEELLAINKSIKDFDHVMKRAQYESAEKHEQYTQYQIRVELLNDRYHRPTVLKHIYEIDNIYEEIEIADAELDKAVKDEYIERAINDAMAERGVNVVRYAVMDGSGKPWRLMFDTNEHKAVAVLKGSSEQQVIMRVVEADPAEFSEDPNNPTIIKDMKIQDQSTVDKAVQDQVEFCDFYKQFSEDLKKRGVFADTSAGFVRPPSPDAAVEIHPHDYVPPTPSADAERRLRNRRQASQLKQREMR